MKTNEPSPADLHGEPPAGREKIADRRNGYLHKVLEQIANHPAQRVHEFLPWNLDGVRRRFNQRDAA